MSASHYLQSTVQGADRRHLQKVKISWAPSLINAISQSCYLHDFDDDCVFTGIYIPQFQKLFKRFLGLRVSEKGRGHIREASLSSHPLKVMEEHDAQKTVQTDFFFLISETC